MMCIEENANAKPGELFVTFTGISDEQVVARATSILEERFKRSDYLTSPDTTRQFLKLVFATKTREEFMLVFLDNQHGILGQEVLFQGTIDGANVYPREVVEAALRYQCSAVVLAHNHPSGLPLPSEADKAITRRLIEALNTVDIRVLDHLIIAGCEAVSFAELGLI